MYRTPTQLQPAAWPGAEPRPLARCRWVPVSGLSIATAPAMAAPAVVKRNGVGTDASRTNSFVHTHATTRRGAPPP